jgi:diadenosine tetraphosphate (Ap4A) HIT family hydrolase
MSTCPFCSLPVERIIHTSQHGVIIRDGYPISPGHTLVIPRRHIDSFFNLTAEEKLDLLGLLEIAKAGMDAEFNPDSYNIGINDGPAAGSLRVSH